MVVSEKASHWDYFHLLGSFEEQRKFNYAVKLYVLFVNDDSDESTREYILTRVIQALGAMSNSMRAGAFSLLCTILVNCPDRVHFDDIKKLVNTHLKPAGTAKADAEAYVGELLSYKAIVQSKFIDNNPAHLQEVATNLMELCVKKSYLHAEALRLLGHITVVAQQEFSSEAFVRHLKNLEIATLDKLHYLLKLDQTVQDSETLSYLFDGKRLLSSGAAPEVGILFSKCQNPAHPFIKDFFEALICNDKYIRKLWKTYEDQVKDKMDSKSVMEMYLTIMDEILQQMRGKMNFKQVGTIVTDTAIRTLLRNKLKPELTRKVCKSITDVLNDAKDSALSLEILNKLVFDPGNFSFDEETGSRVVGSAWRSLAVEEAREFCGMCLNIIVKGEGVKNKDRLNALNIYSSMVSKLSTDDKWHGEQLQALLKTGLLEDRNVNAELAVAIRKAFFNSLSMKFPSLPAYAEALKELVKCLNNCLKKKLRIKVTEEVKNAWDLAQKLISKLNKNLNGVADDKKVIINALELITCFIALKSIYDPTESHFNLTDLESVFQRINSNRESEDLEWIEVVMDLFLSMLSKENASNRKIVNVVFKSMVTHMNDGAFMQLIDVLRPSYDLKSLDDPKGENVEEEEVSDDNDSSEESDDNDGSGESDEDEEAEEDEEEGDDEEDTDSRTFNQERLQFELRKALTPADSDNESINIDDMDEEQGKQLDSTLSAIFKNAKLRKSTVTKESVTTHFRTRVLDLLETYCLAGMPLDHWMTLIPAVLELANSVTASKNAGGLKHRIFSFVKRISLSSVSDVNNKDFDSTPLILMLEQLVTKAANASGVEQDLSKHYLELVKFCIRNCNRLPPLKKQVDVATLVVESFFSDKKSLQIEIVRYLCTTTWFGLHDTIQAVVLKTFSLSTKLFKRSKGLELLTAYFKSDRLFAAADPSSVQFTKELISSILDGWVELKSNQSFDLASSRLAVGLVVSLHESKCSALVDWKKWKTQIPVILSCNNKKLKHQLSNLCAKLGLSADDVFRDESEPRNKEHPRQRQQKPLQPKKRKSVDARKLKKESKVRRLAAMDGLKDLTWSKLSADA